MAVIVLADSPKIKRVFENLTESAEKADVKRIDDPLYTIFEHYLLNALVEDETSDEFVTRVVREYLSSVSETSQGRSLILKQHQSMVEEDLREEVLEMLRKKTYGHFSLADFRKSKTARASASKTSRMRPRRPA